MSRKSKIILFLVGISIFTYLVWDFGIDNILINFHKTGWYFIHVIGVWAFVYLFNALSWKYVIGNGKSYVPFSKIILLTISGFAINYITPIVGLGGEPYRVAELKETLGRSKALSVTFLYTMIHALSSFIFWMLVILLALLLLPLSITAKAFLVVIFFIFTIIVLFFISRHKKGVVKSLLNITSKIPFINKFTILLYKKIDFFNKVDEQIVELYLKRKLDFYISLSFDILARIIGSLENLFILKAIGVDISLPEALFISAVSSFVINMFFFMPFELGSREGSLALVMNSIGITSSLGIYIGLVNRLRELFWILIGIILIAGSGKKIDKEIIKTKIDYEKSNLI